MKNRIQICIYILLALLAACSKDATTGKPSTSIIEGNLTITKPASPALADGFGASTKPLSGVPYSFPDGISMIGSVTTSLNSNSLTQIYECPTDGTLPFYMTLQNSKTIPVTIIFPAGLVLPSTDTTLQGGVIVQPDTFSLPANSTLCVNLYAYCINDKRTFNNNAQPYGAPLISNNANLNPLIELLSKKKTITYDPSDIVQKAVWNIADGGGMTYIDEKGLNSFP